MSLMDKIKSMFSGGSDSPDQSHAGHDPSPAHEDLVVEDVPPAPVDPIGTPAATPPADRDEQL